MDPSGGPDEPGGSRSTKSDLQGQIWTTPNKRLTRCCLRSIDWDSSEYSALLVLKFITEAYLEEPQVVQHNSFPVFRHRWLPPSFLLRGIARSQRRSRPTQSDLRRGNGKGWILLNPGPVKFLGHAHQRICHLWPFWVVNGWGVGKSLTCVQELHWALQTGGGLLLL